MIDHFRAGGHGHGLRMCDCVTELLVRSEFRSASSRSDRRLEPVEGSFHRSANAASAVLQ